MFHDQQDPLPRWIGKIRKLPLFMGFLAAAIVGAVVAFRTGQIVVVVAAAPHITPAAAVPLRTVEDRQRMVEESLSFFLASNEVGEKAQWVLDPARVRDRMKLFYETNGEQDPGVIDFAVGAPVRAGIDWWFPVEYTTKRGRRGTLIMKETSEGGLLDWESFVSYGTVPWEEFVTGRNKGPGVFRVRIRPNGFYEGEYSEENYLSVTLAHDRSSQEIHGFAARESPVTQMIESMAGETLLADAHLIWDEDSPGGRSVRIVDILSRQWIAKLVDPVDLPSVADLMEPLPEIPVIR